jgi:hypothetical protein
MADIHKRKASEELLRPTKKMKLSCPALPVEIWSAIEKEVLSVTTRAALRSVCKLFADLFDDRDQWTKFDGGEDDPREEKFFCEDEDLGEERLTYQLKSYCRIDGPHTLQYHIIFRRNGLASCFELGHRELVYLFSKVGGKCDLRQFPQFPTTENVQQFSSDAAYWLLNSMLSLSGGVKTYEDKAYLWIIGPNLPASDNFGASEDSNSRDDSHSCEDSHSRDDSHSCDCSHSCDDIFLFLEFGLHSPTVRSYQWPLQFCSNHCFNRPYSRENKESSTGIEKIQHLWGLCTAQSVFFFDPTTRMCWDYYYLEEPDGHDGLDLVRADTVLDLPASDNSAASDDSYSRDDSHSCEDSHSCDDSHSSWGEPISRSRAHGLLVYDDGRIREQHPYPKPISFIVTEVRLFNK